MRGSTLAIAVAIARPRMTTQYKRKSPLRSLRGDGFDLDHDTRPGKCLDDQKRGRRVVTAHDPLAYAEIVVQDRLVRDVDGEFGDVRECHVGRGENDADALEDHLDLFERVPGHD